MKRKTNKNQITKLEAFLQTQQHEDEILKYGSEGNEFEVHVKKTIDLDKMAGMVRGMADMILSGEAKSIREYMPEYTELARRFEVINYFTDFELPQDAKEIWHVLTDTTIYQDVVEKLDTAMLDNIFSAAEKLINSRRKYLESQTDFNALMDKFTSAADAFANQMQGVEVKEIVDALKQLPNVSTEETVDAMLKVQTNNNNAGGKEMKSE